MTQGQGISLWQLSKRTGIRLDYLQWMAKNGLIEGCRKHLITKQWMVYPPFRFVTKSGGVHRYQERLSGWKGGNAR